MLRRLLLFLLAMTAVPAFAQDRIDRLFTDYMAREQIPGAVLVVLRDDNPAIVRAWGSMRADAVQPIYSVSKQFTAALVMRLAELDRIDLDAPVGRYLPEWFADEPDLLVRHLLNHSSGLADFISLPEARRIEQAAPGTGGLADVIALSDRQPRRFAPGQWHSYSNANFTALALIAERASGLSLREAQRRHLLDPLGLDAIDECAALDRSAIAPGHERGGAVYSLPSNLIPTYSGNGGLCASAEALARWMRALGTGRVVRRDLLAAIGETVPVGAGFRPPYGYGLSALPLAGRPALSHAGGGEGWGAWAAHLPAEGITIAILANRGWLWSTDLGVPLVRILTGQSPPPRLRRLRLTRAERAALTGAFDDGLFAMTLRAEPDRLILTNPPFGDPIALWRQRDGRFVSPERPDTFSLRLVDGRPEFDWMEHRSYLRRAR